MRKDIDIIAMPQPIIKDYWELSTDLVEGDIYTIAGFYNEFTGELQQFTFTSYHNRESQ